MNIDLSYIESSLKKIMALYPEYYDHILTGDELSDFIIMLMNSYSKEVNRSAVVSESKEILAGDFFISNQEAIIQNKLNDEQLAEYRKTFSEQTESFFLDSGYDISASRMIRFIPAQWHYNTYFFVYFTLHGNCPIHFLNNETVTMKKGNIMIVAPFVEHATPCFSDDAYLEYFVIRRSSFEKVFWDQLNKDSIMSHFFRKALKDDRTSTTSYLLFDFADDADIIHLIRQIKEEIHLKLPYSSPLINALMSALFSLTLRRYESSVILPSSDHNKWKSDYSRIFTYIQNNYRNLNLQEIAHVCGYSPKQIGRIVNNYFNMSYTELITFMKMDKAASMLRENSRSIEEISTYLGYADLPSFYRAFKKYYRVTPVQFLKNDLM